jgi:hypothetical protein
MHDTILCNLPVHSIPACLRFSRLSHFIPVIFISFHLLLNHLLLFHGLSFLSIDHGISLPSTLVTFFFGYIYHDGNFVIKIMSARRVGSTHNTILVSFQPVM